MPRPNSTGLAPVNGIEMYYARFGKGRPLLLIHNGLGDADDWAGVVPILARHYEVIVADTRGFGRSTRDAKPFTYGLLACDYLRLLDYLKIDQVILVGTSDGGIIGIDIAIHHPQRLTGLFIQGANASSGGIDPHPSDLTAIRLALARGRSEYLRLSRTPEAYDAFRTAVEAMAEPAYSPAQLSAIKAPTTIVLCDHEESIKRSHTEFLAQTIPGAQMIVLTGVSHFAPIQDPKQFARAVLAFLRRLSQE